MNPDSTANLAQALQYTPGLNGLYLTGNEVGFAGAVALAGAFLHLPCLQNISLSGTHLEPEGTRVFFAALARLPFVSMLSMSDNRDGMSSDCLTELLNVLPRLPYLSFLTLSVPLSPTVPGRVDIVAAIKAAVPRGCYCSL